MRQDELPPYSDLLRRDDGDLNREAVYEIHEGELVSVMKDRDLRFNRWKGARKILALPDSVITEYPPRARSGIVDFRIGDVEVSFGHGKEKQGWLCHRNGHGNDCPHIRKIQRWRKERAAA